MARKRKQPDSGPSRAYLISFGDTMTALLAFFIVLNSLAKEQTGANLHAGTGSFMKALSGLGLPGMLGSKRAERIVQFDSGVPHYMLDGAENTETDLPKGPDESDNGVRSIDREQEDFERFVFEMEHLYDVESHPKTKGQIVFDVFESFPAEPPYLSQKGRTLLAETIPLLANAQYRVEIVVWAATPSPSAWERSAVQAASVRKEFTACAHLSRESQERLTCVARPWPFSDAKRPVMSIVVIKTEPAQRRL